MAGAIYVNDDTEITGSFSKIVVVSSEADLAENAVLFDDIQWGRGTVADDDGVNNHLSKCHIHNDVNDMHYSSSLAIEGPICGFRLTNGEVLAYYN
jgi:hypothetical protein|tara:strand:- start:736 stop:1023 length:288 start_codon:yes stop_codon:yes gene_type:complete